MASEEVSNDEIDTIVSESEDVETSLKGKETPKGLQNGSSSKVSSFLAITYTLIWMPKCGYFRVGGVTVLKRLSLF